MGMLAAMFLVLRSLFLSLPLRKIIIIGYSCCAASPKLNNNTKEEKTLQFKQAAAEIDNQQTAFSFNDRLIIFISSRIDPFSFSVCLFRPTPVPLLEMPSSTYVYLYIQLYIKRDSSMPYARIRCNHSYHLFRLSFLFPFSLWMMADHRGCIAKKDRIPKTFRIL